MDKATPADQAVGATELHLYYEGKEVSFDEPDLFPFGETLARQGRFTAGDATRWGDGYEWPRIQGLLQRPLAQPRDMTGRNSRQPAPGMCRFRSGRHPSPVP